ncbi:MAG: hypothetical protein HQK54_05905, partial [Oligoflexales bacterium]|nr:hypothetical protein [Oligoflexales bacterium]
MMGLMTFMASAELWEQDIFWQIRAGNELLTTKMLPYLESWSYTSFGDPWYNFEWLGTIVIALVHRFFDIPGLVILRMALFLSILLILAATLSLRTSGENRWPAMFVILSLAAVAISFRVQVRPDFMILFFYALSGLVWTLEIRTGFKWLATIEIIIVSANLHPGMTLLIILFVYMTAFDRLDTYIKKLLFPISCIAAWLIKPYPMQMPAYLSRYIFYSKNSLIHNPDQDSLRFEKFLTTADGLYPWAYLLLLLLAACPALLLIKKSEKRLLSAGTALTIGVITILILVSINRERAIPYAAIAILPMAFDFMVLLIDRFRDQFRFTPYAMTILLLAGHAATVEAPLGLKLRDSIYPMECISFMQKHRPQGRLFHLTRWGDVVLGLLPGYEVFADSREEPFQKLEPLVVRLFDDQSAMHELLARYDINSVMLPLGLLTAPMHEQAPPWSRRNILFPDSEWAVVAYDDEGMLMIRRSSRHREIIERYGYQLVIPDIPPDLFYMHGMARKWQNDMLFENEVQRCLRDMPRAGYCARLWARWLRRDGSDAGRREAREFLLSRLSIFPEGRNLKAELKMIDNESVRF